MRSGEREKEGKEKNGGERKRGEKGKVRRVYRW